jgi:hypothetical protein
MHFLKQSTATTLLLGPFVDDTDGKTPETGLTISQADVLLWKEGGTTLAQKNESTACTHRSNGMYTCPVNTTDTGTLGVLEVSVVESGALPFTKRYQVVPANVYDSLVLGTDLIDTSMVQIAGTAAAVSTAGYLDTNIQKWNNANIVVPNQAGVPRIDVDRWKGTTAATVDTAGYPVVTVKNGSGAGEISLSSGEVSISSSGRAAIADAVWDEAASGHVTAGSFGQRLGMISSGTATAASGTTLQLAVGSNADDDFYNNAILWITGGTGAGQVRFVTDYTGGTRTCTVDTWVTNPSTDSVYVLIPFGAIPGATAPTASQVADAVLDEAISGHTTEGSLGALLGTLHLHAGTAQAGGASSITFDATGSSTTTDFYKYGVVVLRGGTGAGQSRQITAYSSGRVATVAPAWTVQPDNTSEYVVIPLGIDAATVASIADAVWDEARSGHATAGTFGEEVNANVVKISDDATAASNAESFFDGTGYAGTNNVMPTTTTVTNVVSANVTQISGDSTAADNAEAFFDGTGYAGTGNTIPTVTNVGTVTGNVNGNVGGNVTGSVGSLATQAKADVNAEVLDVLNVDTFAQPGQVALPATTSIRFMVAALYKGFRNRHTQTTTAYSLYNDDATTVDQKATVADAAGTFDRGEIAVGP